MSTRGCIARPLGDSGFTGRYNHFDSYPSGLGRDIWHVLHGRFAGDATVFAKFAIDEHPGGWSSFPDKCYCHWQGREEGEQTITYIAGRPEKSRIDPLFIEWVYIITPTGMDVLNHVHVENAPWSDCNFSGGWRGAYDYARVVFVPWRADEPDWQAMGDQEADPEKALLWLAHPRPAASNT